MAHLSVPGLVVDGSDPTQPTHRLRDIETNDFGIGTDSTVGVYVNASTRPVRAAR